MEQICKEEYCSGCGVCTNICPSHCITIKENMYGAVIPSIEQSKCINCGVCMAVCPQNTSVKTYRPQQCFAAYITDKQKRLDSASGGVATILYESFLKANQLSKVVGVILDHNQNALFQITDCIEYLSLFQGSKYVQAQTGTIYKTMEVLLKSNIHVLFIGLPCQVAACINYLAQKKVSTELLLTVDILCHGVSPQKYLEEQLNHLKKKHNWNSVSHLSFRSNRTFRNFHFYAEAQKDRRKITYNRYSNESPHYLGFLKGITLRESCYHCQFATVERVGDITLGDFIGLGEMPSSTTYPEKVNYNVSMILCNTDKGYRFVQSIGEPLIRYERPIEEAIEGGSSLQSPFKRSEFRDIFLQQYPEVGFIDAMNVAAGEILKKNRRCHFLTRPIKQFLVNLRSQS